MRSIDIKIDIIKFRAKIQHNLPKCLTNQKLYCKILMIYRALWVLTVQKLLSISDIALKVGIDINVLNIQFKPSNFMDVQHMVAH